jgi:crossover junction endodeoxyribonuclease RusA
MTSPLPTERQTVELPWPPEALSPNARGHWSVKHRATKNYRKDCAILALIAKLKAPPGDDVFTIQVEFTPPGRYAYDRDNLLARFKAGADGLADAMKVDDRRFNLVPCYRFDEPVPAGRVVVSIPGVVA